jgi:hypothetical protein
VSPNQKDLNEFLKSIKWSIDNYTELSNDKHFDKWHSATVVIARVHKLEDILNPDFVTISENAELYKENNLFFYSVLQKIIMSHAKVHLHM